eukprot:CAMPEP_0177621334 /NCGR_PEP_ID=MMETSP0419_2-20121207/27527_1 /TAXON_ID=582737 /ORGANISM="Tetraselmis sp., Strain GSL018" /LENGTH=475 /DNA_ID=CAMNT_0019121239 /DNA_START=122 /DNA_END=1545 /DNA_ORIENTATION=+
MGDSSTVNISGAPGPSQSSQGSDGSGRGAAKGTRMQHSPTAFVPYAELEAPPVASSSNARTDSVVRRASKQLLATYRQCEQAACRQGRRAKRRALTEPPDGIKNDGHDNENSDLVLREGDVFESSGGQRYIVCDVLGQGTFGQVVKCWSEAGREYVAVKVIKNQSAYYHQARMEIGVLQLLNRRFDPCDERHIVRLLDFFVHCRHLCLVFELLSVNLYELVKHNHFQGLSMNLLKVLMTQILEALVLLRDAQIIHCDLKPENVLLKGLDSGEIKVIDFGSACFESRTIYSYIQSRFYRSPEVLLGHPYTVAIDMWSFGCVAAELFLGLPLFPGASEYDLLARIIEMLGMPPESLLARARRTGVYFRAVHSSDAVRYELLSPAEVELRKAARPPGEEVLQAHDPRGDHRGIPYAARDVAGGAASRAAAEGGLPGPPPRGPQPRPREEVDPPAGAAAPVLHRGAPQRALPAEAGPPP